MKAFMYHDIRDLENTNFKSRMALKSFLSVQQFKNQLNFIIENYQVISTENLKNIDLNRVEKNYAILTFDDGLLDHYHIASILYDYKISGTFLIPTLAVRDRKMIKSHKIQFILAAVEEKKVVRAIFDYLKLSSDQAKHLWDTYSISRWKNNWWTPEMIFVTNFLRNCDKNAEITNHLFTNLVTADELAFCEDFYLNEDQVKYLVAAGMTVGGHGYSSEALATLENQEEDIKQSLSYVQKFYKKCLSFSYPNGSYNQETIDCMRKYGCEYAFTTVAQDMSNEMDFLAIPRFDAPQTLPL